MLDRCRKIFLRTAYSVHLLIPSSKGTSPSCTTSCLILSKWSFSGAPRSKLRHCLEWFSLTNGLRWRLWETDSTWACSAQSVGAQFINLPSSITLSMYLKFDWIFPKPEFWKLNPDFCKAVVRVIRIGCRLLGKVMFNHKIFFNLSWARLVRLSYLILWTKIVTRSLKIPIRQLCSNFFDCVRNLAVRKKLLRIGAQVIYAFFHY